MLAFSKRPPAATVQSGHIPAPSGVNVVDGPAQLTPADCVLLQNMLWRESGLGNRAGYRDWVTGLGAAVRSLLSFRGSAGDGTKDKFFATTTAGIYDCTSSTATPSSVYSFPTADGTSGVGVARGFVNANGDHFLPYADETNGYIVYSEITGTWVKAVQAANAAWVKNTVYGAGAYVSNYGSTYYTAAGGTSENTDNAGPRGTGSAITDGTVTWAYTPAISGVDPDDIAFVTVWKNRIWLVKKDSQTAYYLPTNSLFGAANSFHFGPQFKYGGHLVGLWSWTIDGGAGVDDMLVAISSAGDLVVYQGTDPSSASTFEIKAVWNVGAVPAGRRIATDYGGDLLILSFLGVVPLSKVLSGASFQDTEIYATRKIATTLGRLMTERSTASGWDIKIHPEDKSLVVLTPQPAGEDPEQWVMALSPRGWTQHTGVPMACAEAWKGKFYFGTSDGRVCINDGDVDNNGISSSANVVAIEAALITSSQNLGNARQKVLQQVKPMFQTNGTTPQFAVESRYDFDVSEPGSIQFVTPTGSGIWDVSSWDVGIWGSGVGRAGEWRGVSGVGTNVAIALRVSSKARWTLVGFDAQFTQGATQ